jgi:hypothetical protein
MTTKLNLWDFKGNKQDIEVTDESNDLKVYHFVQGAEGNRDAAQVRGTIVRNDKEIVMKHLPFVTELTVDECDFADPSKWGIQLAVEGTVIGLFYDIDGWRMCTHRILDGVNNWAGEQFCELFSHVWDRENESQLDPKLAYSFVLVHPDNQIIYEVPKAELYMASVWSTETGQFLPFTEACELAKKMKNVLVPDTFDYNETQVQLELQKLQMGNVELFGDILNNARAYNGYGLLIYPNGFSDTNPQPFKLVSREYLEQRQVRGNVGSLATRYLELKLENDVRGMTLLRTCYPKDTASFDNVDRLYNILCRKISNLYFEKFVKKNVTTLPKEEHVIIHKCHSEYLKDKTVKMSIERVQLALRDTPLVFVKRMMNRLN